MQGALPPKRQAPPTPQGVGGAQLRNQRVLAQWLCRRLKSRRLRGTTMAPPNSVDGSLLGRSVQIRVRFHYKGPIPIDGVELLLNGSVRVKQKDTNEWTVVGPEEAAARGISLTVNVHRRKNQKLMQALKPSHPYRGTGMDAQLNALPLDLDNVCFYNITCTKYANQSPHMLSLAHNIGHDYRAYRDVSSEWYEAQVAMGGLPYAFAEFEPNAERACKFTAIRTAFKQIGASGKRVQYQFTSPAFIASMRFVTGGLRPGDGNAWTGIWPIPPEISEDIGCKVGSEEDWAKYRAVQEARARLAQDEEADATETRAMDTGDDGDDAPASHGDAGAYSAEQRAADKALVAAWPGGEDARPVHHWYAVMRNHPVAWGMEGMYDDQRKGYGVTSAELRVQAAKDAKVPDASSNARHYEERIVNGQVSVPDWAPYVYCHVLPDVQLETLLRHMHDTFQDRIDLRVLGHVGFYLGPYRREQCHVYETLDDGTKMPTLDTQTGQPVWASLDACDVAFDVTMHYMVWPQLPPDAVVTPQLRQDFPSLQSWVSSPMGDITLEELEMARKQYTNHQRMRPGPVGPGP